MLKRDRQIVIAGLVAVILAAWLHILGGAGVAMNDMPAASIGTLMAMTPMWTPGYVAMMLAMWWAMMLAMMLPSAAPMLLLFAAVSRKSRQQGGACAPTDGHRLAMAGNWKRQARERANDRRQRHHHKSLEHGSFRQV